MNKLFSKVFKFLGMKFMALGSDGKENMIKNDIFALMEKVPSPFLVISDRQIIFMNRSMKDLLDFERIDRALPMNFAHYISPEQLDKTESWLGKVRNSETNEELEVKLVSSSKNGLWLTLKGAVIGAIPSSDVLISAFDISEMKKNELMQKRLGDLKDQVILLADSIQDHDSIIPLLEKILDISLSKISKSLFGSFLVLENNEYFRIAAYRGFPPEEIAGALIPLKQSFAYIASGGNIRKTLIIDDISKLPDIDTNLVSFTDSLTWTLRSTLSAPIFVNGKLYGSINIDSKEPNAFSEEDAILMEFFKENVEKAIERTEKMIDLKSKSYIDSLTGLYNRAYFDETLTETIYQSENELKNFCVAVMDLDYLKHVNDKFGHTGGDLLLRHFSALLRDLLPVDTIICRYGGDEFTLLLPDLDEKAATDLLTETARIIKAKQLRFGDSHVPIIFSFGVSEYALNGKNSTTLLESADSKMYEMKWLHKKSIIETTEALNQ